MPAKREDQRLRQHNVRRQRRKRSDVGVADLIPIAQDRRARILGITDSSASPVARDADLNFILETDRPLGVQPLAPQFVLVQSLFMALDEAQRK